jgi:hypothetical protein
VLTEYARGVSGIEDGDARDCAIATNGQRLTRPCLHFLHGSSVNGAVATNYLPQNQPHPSEGHVAVKQAKQQHTPPLAFSASFAAASVSNRL